MCGIAGVCQLDGAPVEERVIDAMGATIGHRGPDGSGRHLDGPVGLSHRRLAVIDPSPAGNQPMTTDDGRFTLVYNGVVYNFRELREELAQTGHLFRSTSDTEVVLRALAQWGEDAVPRLNGIFAFALWDSERREITLGRDRIGVKPLYLALRDGMLAFASEAKALLAHPRMRAEVDPDALVEYFSFQNLFGERTLFRDIRLLSPGTLLRAGPDRPPSEHRYWDFHFEDPDDPADEREYAEELDRLFRRAVSRQLVSDVPLGAYLSGGTDSGSITALAAAALPGLKTFTVGFDLSSASGLELAFDERRSAEHLSYLFQTEHYEMVLKAGDLERVMPKLVWHVEEPRVGQCYPNFYAAQLAARFGKVVLSGVGGDELFGGYPWRYYRATVNASLEEYLDKYFRYWQRLIPDREPRDLFSPIWTQVADVSPRDLFGSVFPDHSDRLRTPEDYINHSLYFEARTFLHGLLVVEDKLSMAHGLETRLPFLDNDLVDFAQRVPVSMKLGNLGEVVRLNENEPGPKTARFFERTRDGKLILRKVMRRHVPATVAEREKQGFSAPDASWFRGESIDYVRRRLLSRDARLYEFLSRPVIEELVDGHLSGRQNRRLLIWSLLYFEQWCETFLDGGGATPSGC